MIIGDLHTLLFAVYMYKTRQALGLCAVLMAHAAALGGLVASAGHSRGNTEDLARMQ